jgi:hypothetical protein
VGIPGDPKVEQIVGRLISPICGNRPFPHKPPQDLHDFKVQEVRTVQRFVTQKYSLVDPPSGGCLKKPINRGGRVQHNQRASRSSCTRRAVSSSSVTGLCLCKR